MKKVLFIYVLTLFQMRFIFADSGTPITTQAINDAITKYYPGTSAQAQNLYNSLMPFIYDQGLIDTNGHFTGTGDDCSTLIMQSAPLYQNNEPTYYNLQGAPLDLFARQVAYYVTMAQEAVASFNSQLAAAGNIENAANPSCYNWGDGHGNFLESPTIYSPLTDNEPFYYAYAYVGKHYTNLYLCKHKGWPCSGGSCSDRGIFTPVSLEDFFGSKWTPPLV